MFGRSFHDPLAVPCPSCGTHGLYRLPLEDLDVVDLALEPYPILCRICSRRTSIPFLVAFYSRAKRYPEALTSLCTKVTPPYFVNVTARDLPPLTSADLLRRIFFESDGLSGDLPKAARNTVLSREELMILNLTEYASQRPDWWLFLSCEGKVPAPTKGVIIQGVVFQDKDEAIPCGILFKAWLLQTWLLYRLARPGEAMEILSLLSDKLFGGELFEDPVGPSPVRSKNAPLSVLFRLLGLVELAEGRGGAGFGWLQVAVENRFTDYERMILDGACQKEIESSPDLLARSGAVGEIYVESEKVRLEMLARSGFRIN